MQYTIDIDYQKYKDKRSQIAYEIYESHPTVYAIIYKTTRAGATTSLTAESINRDELVSVLVPTNSIADKTIVTDSKIYSTKEDAVIIHIPSNHECLINQESIEEYPDLKYLPIMPLAQQCEECKNYEDCPVTEIQRKPEAVGFVLTYKKLVALMLAADRQTVETKDKQEVKTTAGKILNKISESKNLILDEIHTIQFGDMKKFSIRDNKSGNMKNTDLSRYATITASDKFPQLRDVIINFSLIQTDEAVMNNSHLVQGGIEDEKFFEKHLCQKIKNPIELNDDLKARIGCCKELINLMKIKEEYNLTKDDVVSLFDIMTITLSEKIAISAIKDDGVIFINLSAVDNFDIQMLRTFTMSMQNGKRIFLTSATICSFDYSQLFMGGLQPEPIFFGKNGDPKNTNSKMMIIADSKRFHNDFRNENSLFNKKDEIISNIKNILEAYGRENCIVIALNKKQAWKLTKDLKIAGIDKAVTWYKESSLMGVSANERIIIAIGLAYKPSNTFDSKTLNEYESKIMLQESIHADVWQNWSRAKDPNGNVHSLVFALGCPIEECEALTTWGINRTIKINDYGMRQKKIVTVECEKQITKPIIVKCNSDKFEDMLQMAFKHKEPVNIPIISSIIPVRSDVDAIESNDNNTNQIERYIKSENLLIYNNNRRFDNLMYQSIDDSKSLIEFIFNRRDLIATQNNVGGYESIKKSLDESLIQDHLDGIITLGAYQISLDNKIKWVLWDLDAHRKPEYTEETMQKKYDKVESDLNRLCNYLQTQGISYMLEASGSPGSYHVWTFVQPVIAEIGKAFAKDIKNTLGIDAEVFPKQTVASTKRPGSLVKVPLATHQKHGGKSQIMVMGEWTREVKDLDITIMDISNYTNGEAIKKSGPKPRTANKTFHNIVRPCIENALKMQMQHQMGHNMRIAVCREYYNAGIKDPEKLANLFSKQSDYNFKTSLDQVNSLIKIELPNVRCERMREESPDFVHCEDCKFKEGLNPEVYKNYLKNRPTSGVRTQYKPIDHAELEKQKRELDYTKYLMARGDI